MSYYYKSTEVTAGVSGQLLQKLQVIQNAAARLVTGTRRSERMTPILCDLHSSLVTSSTAHHVQDRSSGLQMSAQHGPTVPSDVL